MYEIHVVTIGTTEAEVADMGPHNSCVQNTKVDTI